ncbi:MAG: hypothetical protein AAGA66_12800 [Bacteroidota bacterium]
MEIAHLHTECLSREMIEDCDRFLCYVNVKALHRGLRHMLMAHLIREKEPPSGEEGWIEDLNYLFDFLDQMHDRLNEHDLNPKIRDAFIGDATDPVEPMNNDVT